jgi:hypothetical protein
MSRTAIIVGLAVGLTAAGAQAQAPEHPVFLPTRGVAVTYALSSGAGGPSQTTHRYYSAQANKLRIDTPGDAGYTVLDRGAGQQLLVMNDQHSYAVVPLDPDVAEGFILNSHMQYQREGRRSVAGQSCTAWKVVSQQANGQACVTADGVLLSGSGGSGQGPSTSLTATSVAYGPQSPSLFEAPPGFTKVAPQQLQQMPGGGPGGGPNGPPGGPPQ